MEELATVLVELRKEPVQDQLNDLNEVIRDIFSILLQVPEMIEDQMNDLKAQISTLNADLEQTRGQVKEMQRAALPAPTPPPPAPRTNGNKPPNPSVPSHQEPSVMESKPATSQYANSPIPSPEKPNLHGLVMRELKDLLERRKKFMDSQN